MVILDLHEFQAMGDDPAGNRERFLAVWRQIAEHCKDAPGEVLFEILNEPSGKLTPNCGTPCSARPWGSSGKPTPTAP